MSWLGLMMTLVLLNPAIAGEDNTSAGDRQSAITVFGGLMTDNHWEEVLLPWNTDYRNSTLVGIAVSHGIGRLHDRLDFEIEGQVVRHIGHQNHWEFNLPIVGRWQAFSWDDVVDTSLAFGIGPSLATEKPMVEVANNGDSHKLLVYWLMEIEVGPPDKDWSTILRIHHRSDAFGLVADGGGSNAIVFGLRHRF